MQFTFCWLVCKVNLCPTVKGCFDVAGNTSVDITTDEDDNGIFTRPLCPPRGIVPRVGIKFPLICVLTFWNQSINNVYSDKNGYTYTNANLYKHAIFHFTYMCHNQLHNLPLINFNQLPVQLKCLSEHKWLCSQS